jgi:hypothetical protein
MEIIANSSYALKNESSTHKYQIWYGSEAYGLQHKSEK